MKTPTTTEVMTSAALTRQCILPGELLKRQNTVRAEVLMQLLFGKRLTGLDAVYGASTTRLAAVIYILIVKYGWAIFTNELVTGCADGRNSVIVEYFLLPSTIAATMKSGAGLWCAQVRAARLKLRTKAAEAMRKADAINAARKKRQQDAQTDMFREVSL